MAVPAPRIAVLSALLAFSARDAAAAPHPLDRVRVHGLYQDGEFEKVLRELAAYGKGACTCSRDDSVFAEKHLAVVLAANPVTRELGRYHMHRLLELAPRADLLDMYIGEEVDGVFEKVRKEHALRAAEPAAVPAVAIAVAAPAAPAAPVRPAPSAPSAARPTPPAPPVSRPLASVPAASAPSGEPGSPQSKAYSDAWARLPAAKTPSGRFTAPVAAVGSAVLPVPAGRSAPVAVASFRAKVPAPAAGVQRADAPRSRNAQAPSQAYSPWDQVATASAASGHSVSKSPAKGASAIAATGSRDSKSPDSAAAGERSRPAWKEPGLWIGGGAAIAAIAFTLWQAGSDDPDPSKTYAVPAGLEK